MCIPLLFVSRPNLYHYKVQGPCIIKFHRTFQACLFHILYKMTEWSDCQYCQMVIDGVTCHPCQFLAAVKMTVACPNVVV